MIKYGASTEALNAAIIEQVPRWPANAAKRTEALLKLGRFEEKAAIWSQVKPVYIRLQRNKCAFCERQFETPDYGAIEFDVEHFRPKSSVLPWPDARRHSGVDYVQPDAGLPGGYYWLAYQPLNYAASCKVCNSILKLNYFPIAGERGSPPASPLELESEHPYLCYPIGDSAQDPETLITFVANIAVPTQADGEGHLRGRVIIDFFELNKREQLLRERAEMIALFGPAFEARAAGAATALHLKLIDKVADPGLRHSNCLRAFARLWQSDAAQAAQVLAQCQEYWLSGGAPLAAG